jgi:hypothetical protein
MSNKVTQLASAQLDGVDELVVQLIRPTDTPALVRIVWPSQPTIVDPKQYAEAAAIAMKVLAGASVELSRLQATKRGLL